MPNLQKIESISDYMDPNMNRNLEEGFQLALPQVTTKM